MSYYPVFLDIGGRRCVVAGGGQVAMRKVRVMLEHGANVEVVSPNLCPELARLAKSGKIKVLDREYRTGDLRGAFVAMAATDNDFSLWIDLPEIIRYFIATGSSGGHH